MKRLNYRVVWCILVVFILAMVAVVPASADRPEHSRTVSTEDGIFNVCGVDMDSHLETKLGFTIFVTAQAWSQDP